MAKTDAEAGSVLAETDALIASLGELSPHGLVLAALARELASSVDDPPPGAGGGTLSIGPFANSLRATVDQLIERGAVDDADDDADDDWAGIASEAGATPLRHPA